MPLLPTLLTLLCQTVPATPTPDPTPGPDPTMDWLLNQSAPAPATRPATQPTSQPATQPTTQPTNPLKSDAADAGLPGRVTLSDGTTLRGALSTTPGKPLRFWVEAERRYVDLPLASVRSLRAKVLWERDEPEWRFKASGSDEKILTGRTYPVREVAYTVTLRNGDTLTGSVAAPIVVETEAGTQRFVLHKREKGKTGESLKELVYVKQLWIDGRTR